MHQGSTGPVEPGLSTGERIKFFRMRRGMTRDVLGGLVGKSGRWVKAVESGQIQTPRLPVLVSIAEVLKIRDLSELTGGQSMPTNMFRGPGHPALSAVRDAVNEVGSSADVEAQSVASLRARLAAAWRARHAAPDHRTVIGELLPGLIRGGKATVRARRGDERREALATLAGIYHLAQFFTAYQPDTGLLWRVAERGLMAAEESEDPKALADSAWLLVEAHRDIGDFDAAESVARRAIEQVAPHLDGAGDGLVGAWGGLHFAAAYTAARAGERGTAWRWWEKADAVASRLPAGHYDPMTSFGRAVMPAHAVTVAVELRQKSEAAQQTRRAANTAIPSAPRQARHLVEMARAHQIGGDSADALATLRTAFATAPETVRFNGYAHRMIRDLAEGPLHLRGDARVLADRVGLLV
ncbi:helix-turn-helix domain-containing protein [Actinocorallia sp. API 0066]|uniref:helix-turn-helix domain-containing protein n=1 Tax=Actinocorallia sp. API 0066 TaxID=2896846 RepID=UPI001E497F10|nr:helix-turn-helix transcriptional regulator [Actinocorallia sp. API 0066]MCD0450754.1 helix-turn-helix domain-containing protein [Actinocorallia sp. API 0066]